MWRVIKFAYVINYIVKKWSKSRYFRFVDDLNKMKHDISLITFLGKRCAGKGVHTGFVLYGLIIMKLLKKWKYD